MMPIFMLSGGGGLTGRALNALEGVLLDAAIKLAQKGSLTGVETFEDEALGLAGGIQMVQLHCVVGHFRGPVFKLTLEAGSDDETATEFSRYMVDGAIIRHAERAQA